MIGKHVGVCSDFFVLGLPGKKFGEFARTIISWESLLILVKSLLFKNKIYNFSNF